MQIGKLLRRLVAFGAGCLAYGTFIESKAFVVRRVDVPILPAGMPSLRVLHISDLHLLRRNKARQRFMATLAGLEPDLVVNTGDNVAEPQAVDALAQSLGKLLQIPGVFVYGSADYEAPVFNNPIGYIFTPTTRSPHPQRKLSTVELEAALTSGTWVNVTGKRATLEINGIRIEFRGTDDAHLGLDEYHNVAGPSSEGIDISIGVTHAPYLRVLEAMIEDHVQLIFAGHTHGGQVCVPGFGALTTNCDLDTKYAKGLSRQSVSGIKAYLHVSAGLGTSPFAPYRLSCPPEATLLTLTEKKKSESK